MNISIQYYIVWLLSLRSVNYYYNLLLYEHCYGDTLGTYNNLQKIFQGNLSGKALFLKQITNEIFMSLEVYTTEKTRLHNLFSSLM